jgi:hypothetical protein
MSGVMPAEHQAGLYSDKRARQESLIELIARLMVFLATGDSNCPDAGNRATGMKQ